MPLNTRSIAVSLAVVGFFGIAVVTWLCGLPPYTCCKRAVVAALAVYAASSLAVKAVNAILISAMVPSQVKQIKETARAGKD